MPNLVKNLRLLLLLTCSLASASETALASECCPTLELCDISLELCLKVVEKEKEISTLQAEENIKLTAQRDDAVKRAIEAENSGNFFGLGPKTWALVGAFAGMLAWEIAR